MNSVKKIALFLIAAAVVIGCIFTAGCVEDKSNQAPSLTITVEKGGSFSYAIGDTFTVALPSNPSTGYHWVVTSAEGLDYKELGFESSSQDSQVLGAPGKEKFVFTTKDEGIFPFTLSYVKSGEDAGIYVYNDMLIVEKDAAHNFGSFDYDGTYLPYVGDVVEVKVRANIGSPEYIWTINPADGLNLVKESFEKNDSGVVEYYVWSFTANQPGSYELVAAESLGGNSESIVAGFFLPITFQPYLTESGDLQ